MTSTWPQRVVRGTKAALTPEADAHSANREFFIAKAIGLALRNIARLDEMAFRRFLFDHPKLSYVAVREAQRVLKD